MNDSDRATIERHFKSLVTLIDFYKIDQLVVERGIFTKIIMDDIKSARNVQDRIISLLQELPKRGPLAFEVFVEVLKETGQNEAALLLKPNDIRLMVTTDTERRVDQQMVVPVQVNNNNNNANGIHEDGLPNLHLGGHTFPAEESRQMELQISPEGVVYHIGPDCYAMNKPERGRCLIINNIEFQGPDSRRLGSEADARRLDQVFQQLHFRVILRSNLTRDGMRKLLRDYAQLDHSEANAFVVIILSHGEEVDRVLGVDGLSLSIVDIYMMFNNINCPTLISKPKLFFIQACRGRMFDCGTTENVVADAMISASGRAADTVLNSSVAQNNTINSISDICVSWSTVQRFVSNRNETLGSWYARALCDTLIRDSQRAELNELLSTLDRSVQSMRGAQGEKQATERNYIGWNKKFYFNPGYFL